MNDILAYFIRLFGMILYLAILGRVLMSWFPTRPDNPIVALLFQITEPILGPLRRIVPRFGMLDLTPMVALLLIFLIQWVLLAVLS